MAIYTEFYKYKAENGFNIYTKSSLNYKKHMNRNQPFAFELKLKNKSNYLNISLHLQYNCTFASGIANFF